MSVSFGVLALQKNPCHTVAHFPERCLNDRLLVDTGAPLVRKNDELCIENEEICIRNEELCIKNDEFCIYNDEFCRAASPLAG